MSRATDTPVFERTPHRAWSRRARSPRGDPERQVAFGAPPRASSRSRSSRSSRWRDARTRPPTRRPSPSRTRSTLPRWTGTAETTPRSSLPWSSGSRTRSGDASASAPRLRSTARPPPRRTSPSLPCARTFRPTFRLRRTTSRRGPPAASRDTTATRSCVSAARASWWDAPPPSTRWWAGTRTRSWNRRRASRWVPSARTFRGAAARRSWRCSTAPPPPGSTPCAPGRTAWGSASPCRRTRACTTSPRSRAWTGCCTKPGSEACVSCWF